MRGRFRWALGPKVSPKDSVSTMWERYTVRTNLQPLSLRGKGGKGREGEEIGDVLFGDWDSQHRRGVAWATCYGGEGQSTDRAVSPADSCGNGPARSVR